MDAREHHNLKESSPLAVVIATVAIVAAAALGRWLLDPVLGDNVPFITFFLAVVVAAWFGGLRPALLATGLSLILAWACFIPPRFSFELHHTADIVGLVVFLLVGLAIARFSGTMREAQRRAVIAERLAAERAERLHTTLASIGDAVIATDAECRVTSLNGVAESLTGWTNAAALGQSLDTVFHIVNESTRQKVENPATRALREGAIVGLANHTILISKDGSEYAIDDSAAPIRDGAGRINGCILIFRDITQRRNAERLSADRLKGSRLLASIVETSEDAIVSKSIDGIIQSWNAAAERLFGYTAEQAVGQPITIIIPPDRGDEEKQIIGNIRAGKRVEHFETLRLRRDGQLVDVSLSVSPIRDEEGRVIGAAKIARDITDRRRAEVALRESEERRRLALNSADLGAWHVDPRTMELTTDERFRTIFGVTENALSYEQAVALIHPDDQARVMDAVAAATRPDDPEPYSIDYRVVHPDGSAHWVFAKGRANYQYTGSTKDFVSFDGTVADITERRQLEENLQLLAADLSEANDRKDEFLATLAHELRNPLAPIRNMLEVMKLSEGDVEASKQARDTMERQLAQMVRLVDDLLDVSRITRNKLELRQERVELASVIHHSVEVCRPLAECAKHEVTVNLPQEPIYLYADATRLTQVFGNILNNACKYTEPCGKIWLTAEREGSDVVVTVKDNGTGIPPDKLNKVFDMFAQVDRSFERTQGGLGIGLSLVKRLVEMHGGSIDAKSDGEGKGSEFTVRLPVLIETPKKLTVEPQPQNQISGLRILVVDDNQDSANSLAMLLKISGNETHAAHDGIEAIEAAEKLRPDVVLLDIGLTCPLQTSP